MAMKRDMAQRVHFESCTVNLQSESLLFFFIYIRIDATRPIKRGLSRRMGSVGNL